MSETNVATPADPVHLVWSILCQEGFDAAQQCAVALAHDGATPQIHADLCASAGHFEQAYHSASLGQGESTSGGRYARLALFADALGKQNVAKHYSELAVAAQPEALTLEWIVWLIDRCRAYSAAAHLLRAYAQRAPHDARAPWWLAVALASVAGGQRRRLNAVKRWCVPTNSIRRFIRYCRCISCSLIGRSATGIRLSAYAVLYSRRIPLIPKWPGN